MRHAIRTLQAVMAVLVFCCTAPAPAATQAPVEFNLPAQPLADSLRAVAGLTNSNILFDRTLVRGLLAKPLKAQMSVEEALKALLKGTGLTYRNSDDKTIMIVSERASRGSETATVRAPDTIAQTMQRADGQPDTAGRAQPPSEEPEEADSTGVPEILVAGSRSLNMDIERTEGDVQPYVVIGADEIATSQAINIQELLDRRLPMNNKVNVTTPTRGGPATTASEFSLRGLGSEQTLILVNGRRLPRLALGEELGQADLNGIPLSSIERIEVLPSTASAMYGGSATGGAINVILKRDYHGFDMKLAYRRPIDINRYTRSIDLGGGNTFGQGRTHLSFSGTLQESVPLLAGDRDFTRQAREMLMRNNPGGFNTYELPTGSLPNISSADGTPLVLLSGTPLGYSFTHVPAGYAGIDSDGGARLAEHAGQYDLSLTNARAGQGSMNSLAANQTIRSGMFSLRHEFSERMQAYLDLSVLGNKGRLDGRAGSISAFIPAGAASNPFQNDIYVALPVFLPERPVSYSTSTTRQVMTGLIARLGGGWAANLDLAWSESRQEQENQRDSVVLDYSIYNALGDGTLDVLRDLTEYPIDYSPYYFTGLEGVSKVGPHRNDQSDISLRLTGPVAQLPGGPLSLAFALENRKERVDATYDFQSSGGYGAPSPFVVFTPSRSQRVRNAYVEMVAPVISSINARSWLQDLQLTASLRYDDYLTDTSGQAVQLSSVDDPLPEFARARNTFRSEEYLVGLRYAPIKDLTLRTSFSTGFLPPSFTQLTSFDTQRFCFLSLGGVGGDPQRGFTNECGYNTPGEPYIPGLGGLIDIDSGGDPALAPETSKSTTVGIILTPRFMPGLRFSADYTRIRKTGEIASLLDWDLVRYEELFPGRVIRGEKSPDDPAEWAGPIIGLDTRLNNISRTRIDALDFQIDYAFPVTSWGQLSIYTIATRQIHLARQIVDGGAFDETVGDYSGALPWRGNVGADWTKGNWGAGWNVQYFDAYPLYQSGSTPEAIERIALNQGGSPRIPSQTYQDIYVKYRTPGGLSGRHALLSDMEIHLGIQNVFDTQPELVAGQGVAQYSDILLRRVNFSVRRSF